MGTVRGQFCPEASWMHVPQVLRGTVGSWAGGSGRRPLEGPALSRLLIPTLQPTLAVKSPVGSR